MRAHVCTRAEQCGCGEGRDLVQAVFDMDIKPLVSHSTSGELNSPPNIYGRRKRGAGTTGDRLDHQPSSSCKCQYWVG
eukprot:3872883-Pyramimonas_sp.AAC.1